MNIQNLKVYKANVKRSGMDKRKFARALRKAIKASTLFVDKSYLSGCFSWIDTPQGFAFWRRLDVKCSGATLYDR